MNLLSRYPPMQSRYSSTCQLVNINSLHPYYVLSTPNEPLLGTPNDAATLLMTEVGACVWLCVIGGGVGWCRRRATGIIIYAGLIDSWPIFTLISNHWTCCGRCISSAVVESSSCTYGVVGMVIVLFAIMILLGGNTLQIYCNSTSFHFCVGDLYWELTRLAVAWAILEESNYWTR